MRLATGHLEPSKFCINISRSDGSGNLVQKYSQSKRFDACILGVPFDYGVELSGGRVGARLGPDAIRAAMGRHCEAYSMERGVDIGGLSVCDIGNVKPVEGDSGETHARVSSIVSRIVAGGAVPIVLGGGHDITFANVRGMCSAIGSSAGGINIDAHLDVRRVVNGRMSSGTPFRRVLEELDGKVKGRNLVEIGAHGNLNSKENFEYAKARHVKIITLDMVRRLGMRVAMRTALATASAGTAACFVSADVDSLPQYAAPGSSAPSPIGIEVDEMLEACFIAGSSRHVRLFDIMELNPKYDADGRTANIASAMIMEFLDGLASRRGGLK